MLSLYQSRSKRAPLKLQEKNITPVGHMAGNKAPLAPLFIDFTRIPEDLNAKFFGRLRKDAQMIAVERNAVFDR